MPDLEALRATDDPAIPLLREWAAAAACKVEIFDPADPSGRVLAALQVSRRSMLGALADDTGGVLVDHGWLRHLGGGSRRLPRDLAGWNGLGTLKQRVPGALLIADDAIGGFFAVNGGGLPGAAGNVCYFAPDQLEWEDLEIGHSAFVHWTFSGKLAEFYEAERWPGWEREVERLPGDRALSVVPFLWAEGPPIERRSRRDVPIEDLWGMEQHMATVLASPKEAT